MTEPDATPEALPEADPSEAVLPVQEQPASTADAELRRRSNLQLAAGVLVFLAASLVALVTAGSLGAGGVLIAALIEAAAIAWLYRWCEA